MSDTALSPRERTAVATAGLASVVLMLLAWFVMPRLNALVFAPGEVLPAPIRLFQSAYAAWPFILFASTAIGVLLSRFGRDGFWRRALWVLEWVLAACAIALIALGVVAAYLPIFLLPGKV
jgi:hypothetical protein